MPRRRARRSAPAPGPASGPARSSIGVNVSGRSGAAGYAGARMTRTAVVTGGAGFIGSHVVDALLAEGREVVVVDDLSTGQPERVADAATLERVDITDAAALDRVVDAAKPDAIFHLAAQASVVVSVEDP